MHVYYNEKLKEIHIDDGTRIISINAKEYDELEINFATHSAVVIALLEAFKS